MSLRSARVWSLLLLVLLDTIWFCTFAFVIPVPWDSSSEVLKRIFSFFLLSIPESGSFFDVVFWITAAIVILVGSLLLSGNQKIAKFKERSSFVEFFFNTFCLLVLFILFSSIACTYACTDGQTKCPEKQLPFLNVDNGIRCWEGSHIAFAVFGIVALVLYYLCILIEMPERYTYAESEGEITARIPSLRADGQYIMHYTHIKVLMVALATFFQLFHPYVVVGCLLCGQAVIFVLHFRSHPFNSYILNYIRNCGLCFSTWTMLCAMAALSINDSTNHLPFWLLMGGYGFLILALWLLYFLCYRHIVPHDAFVMHRGLGGKDGSSLDVLSTDYHRLINAQDNSFGNGFFLGKNDDAYSMSSRLSKPDRVIELLSPQEPSPRSLVPPPGAGAPLASPQQGVEFGVNNPDNLPVKNTQELLHPGSRPRSDSHRSSPDSAQGKPSMLQPLIVDLSVLRPRLEPRTREQFLASRLRTSQSSDLLSSLHSVQSPSNTPDRPRVAESISLSTVRLRAPEEDEDEMEQGSGRTEDDTEDMGSSSEAPGTSSEIDSTSVGSAEKSRASSTSGVADGEIPAGVIHFQNPALESRKRRLQSYYGR